MTATRPLALLVMVATGCKSPTYTESIKPWTDPAAEAAWRGAWVVTLQRDRYDDEHRVALHVTGDHATIFDGTTERTARFSIDRPCEATIVDRAVTYHLQFAYVDGELTVGAGAIGVRRGTSAIVCGTGRDPNAEEEGVYILDGNSCTSWKPNTTGWVGRTGVCVQSTVRGRDEVRVGTAHYASALLATGPLLASAEFEKMTRVASFDEAKARLGGTR